MKRGSEKVQQELITAKQAAWILENYNKQNRPLSSAHYGALASDMRNGRWTQTCDTIKFDRDGNLIDGQHRLYALVLSGGTQIFYVARGVDQDAFEKIDRNKKRNTSDLISIFENRNSTCQISGKEGKMLSGIINWILKIECRERTNIRYIFERYIEFREELLSAKEALSGKRSSDSRTKRIPFSLKVALLFLLRRRRPELADNFCLGLHYVREDEPKDLIFFMKQSLCEIAMLPKNSRNYVFYQESIRLILFAWEKLCKKYKVTSHRGFRQGFDEWSEGITTEFPKIFE